MSKRTPALTRNRNELEKGDIVRNCGDGAKIMQVMKIDNRSVTLVSAGKVRGGKHNPPIAPRITTGTVCPEGRVWTGTGVPPSNKRSHGYYEKVDANLELKELVV